MATKKAKRAAVLSDDRLRRTGRQKTTIEINANLWKAIQLEAAQRELSAAAYLEHVLADLPGRETRTQRYAESVIIRLQAAAPATIDATADNDQGGVA